MKRLAASAFLCFAVTSQLHAEPGPIGRYLMSKEVSLFSFGLFQLERFIKELETEHDAKFWAKYIWDENRIHLWPWYQHFRPKRVPCPENPPCVTEQLKVHWFND